jgi:hypothetical protein
MSGVEQGIKIEGIEPSADMRSLCRRRAAERGVSLVVHTQAMQTLQLSHRFAAIIVPCGTIHLLVDRDEMWEGLKRSYQHLRPGGLLVVIVYNSWAKLNELKSGEWHFLFKARGRPSPPTLLRVFRWVDDTLDSVPAWFARLYKMLTTIWPGSRRAGSLH